ncbi:hypothetical protein BGZ61DRAFT_520843 [Ilyonectria robusta]|uniref:uncharacterized protein n=1 Tax=Ilyonectria robusta TaxID=1079257 RepID=UPI001E8EB019|nr:uncharacterized protein BGZ61DRAFT_520843 [Ilyonectria robusta]KAH8674970.1 hypothetical protein BGZ61DRAFT_520843 [Ilyonectria robusta]
MDNSNVWESDRNLDPVFATPHGSTSYLKHGLGDLSSGDEYDSDSSAEDDLEDVSLNEAAEDTGCGDEAWEVNLLAPNEGVVRPSIPKDKEANSLPSALNGMHDKLPNSTRRECIFDDREMVVIPHASDDENLRDCEEDTTHTFVVPFHERVQVNYEDYTEEQLRPRTAKAKALVRSLPGARQVEDATAAVATGAKALQAGATGTYTAVSGQVGTAVRFGCEAAVLTGQVRSYLFGEAWNAGMNMSVAIQESFPAVVRPLRDGWDVVGGILTEGVMALPPHDGIVGRRRRRI